MAILFPELPLQHLGMIERVAWYKARAVSEVSDNRIAFSKCPTVIQDQ